MQVNELVDVSVVIAFLPHLRHNSASDEFAFAEAGGRNESSSFRIVMNRFRRM